MSDDLLTEEEVQNLPLWARCYWYIQGWKRPFIPRSIKEWAKEVGWNAIDVDSPYVAEEMAIRKAECLYEFVSEIAAQAAQNTLDALQKMKTFQRYLKPEELSQPGYYWWLPEVYRDWPNEPGCWTVVCWSPYDPNRPENGIFSGPIQPPVAGKEEENPEECTPKICP